MREIKTTGLYDNSGREINEGDEVKLYAYSPLPVPFSYQGVVHFEDGAFRINHVYLDGLIKQSPLGCEILTKAEIIKAHHQELQKARERSVPMV